jgi:nitrite reductase (NADH) small subunit
MSDSVPVCSWKDLKDGAPLGVVKDGRRLVVCRVGDAVHALDGVCPHRGAPLEDGFVHEGRIVCPWHGWAFGLTDGALKDGGPALRAYPVEIVDGKIVV